MSEYQKCSEKGYCKWLLERCDIFTPKKKGLLVSTLMNVDTGKFTGQMLVYSTGKKEDKGLVVNFCPFCGFSFYDLHKKGIRVGSESQKRRS